MARVIGAARHKDNYGSNMKLSEMAIFIAIGIALIMAGRWYFVVYRNSPGVALGQYLGTIKAGNPEQQYDLIDDEDKQTIGSEKDYAKQSQVAYGYTERITNMVIAEPVPDPKDPNPTNPNVVTLQATLTLRSLASGSGKNTPADLTQTGDTQTAIDTYTLRKDKNGKWKVWLAKTPMTNLLKITPSPPGDSF